MGLDAERVEAWLSECGGEVREIEVRTSRGLVPGSVVSPPPRTTKTVYIVPNTAFGPTPDAPRVGRNFAVRAR